MSIVIIDILQFATGLAGFILCQYQKDHLASFFFAGVAILGLKHAVKDACEWRSEREQRRHEISPGVEWYGGKDEL